MTLRPAPVFSSYYNTVSIEVHIRAKGRLALLDVPELWQSRDLVTMLVWRDFAVRYKQTILGPLWFLLQPLLPTLVYTLVFGAIAGMSTEGIPAFLFFLCNQTIWGYFSTSYLSTSGSLLDNTNLFTKVYFPRLVVPLASLISNVISIVVQLVFFAAAWMWYRYAGHSESQLHGSINVLWIPLLLMLAAAQGLGFGLWMAALTAKYRDLRQISTIVVQLWMYGSSVIIPLSKVPLKYQVLVSLNPVTFLVEAFRVVLLGVGTISVASGLYAVALTIAVLIGGLYVFNSTARSFVDIA